MYTNPPKPKTVIIINNKVNNAIGIQKNIVAPTHKKIIKNNGKPLILDSNILVKDGSISSVDL